MTKAIKDRTCAMDCVAIARRLGISKQAVHQILHTAIRKMRAEAERRKTRENLYDL